jgi:hypothetical protein
MDSNVPPTVVLTWPEDAYLRWADGKRFYMWIKWIISSSLIDFVFAHGTKVLSYTYSVLNSRLPWYPTLMRTTTTYVARLLLAWSLCWLEIAFSILSKKESGRLAHTHVCTRAVYGTHRQNIVEFSRQKQWERNQLSGFLLLCRFNRKETAPCRTLS